MMGGRGGFVAHAAILAGATRVGEAGGVVADHIVEAGGERGRPAATSTAVASLGGRVMVNVWLLGSYVHECVNIF